MIFQGVYLFNRVVRKWSQCKQTCNDRGRNSFGTAWYLLFPLTTTKRWVEIE